MSMKDKFLLIKNQKLFDEIKELIVMGKFKDALEKLDDVQVEYLSPEHQYQARIDAWRGMCITRLGKYEQGLNIAGKILDTHSEHSMCKEAIVDAIITKAFAFSALGKIDDGLSMCRESERILKTLDLSTRENMARLATVLTLQGLNNLHKGEIDTAIDIYLQSHPILMELGNKKSASAALHNVGSAYRTIGDLDKALEYVSKSRSVSEEIEYLPNLAGALTTTGIILHQKGRLEEASNYLDESTKMFKDIGHKVYLARSLYHAIIVAVDQGNVVKAEQLLEDMKVIDDEMDSLLINQHFRVAKALWLKERGHQNDFEEAQELFQQIVNEKITFFEVTFLSLLSLCDLLIDQLQKTGKDALMNTLKEYTDMALEIATNQGSYWLRAETYCLQAQIALIEFEYERAKQLLTQAQLIADEKGLNQLARRISSEFDELLRQEERWTELTRSGASLAKRVEVAQIDERVERMARIQEADSPNEQQDEPIQFMLMSAHGGFCIVSKEFQTTFNVDESLISGFLSAITSFSDEVFSSPLDRIKVGDYIMLFRAIVPFLFCYVFKGESYAALKKVNRVIDALREDTEIWNSLEKTVESGMLNDHVTKQVEEIVADAFQLFV